MSNIVCNREITLIERVKNFMEGRTNGVATLKEIYNHISSEFEESNLTAPNFLKEKIRCVIYRNDNFKRVTKGAYLYTGANSAGLIIHGDGRKLDEIEDNSIDTIITDHPWEDKKAHKSGNQKNFAGDYEDACFRYTQEDFAQKARVLKDGGYLIEFLPTESFSNYEYLYELKQMAKKSGFQYYAKMMWMKNPEGTINTGRTTKGTEDIMVFTKGKPRRLAPDKKPYFTKNILPGRVDIPAPKPKDKRHQAEKNVALYELLLELTTEEGDVALDQFGGSLNIIEAAVNKNRFAIAYEYLAKILHKSINRLKATPLFVSKEDFKELQNVSEENTIDYEDLLGHVPEHNLVVLDVAQEVLDEVAAEENVETLNTSIELESESIAKDKESLNITSSVGDEVEKNVSALDEIDTPIEGIQVSLLDDSNVKENYIPKETSKFQHDILLRLAKTKPELFSSNEANMLKKCDLNSLSHAQNLNELFNKIYSSIYENHYSRLNISMSSEQLDVYTKVQMKLEDILEEKIENEYIRNYYKGYLIETEDFVKYMIKKCNMKSIDEISKNTLSHIDDYLDVVSNHAVFKNKNKLNVKTMILKMLA